VEKIFLLINVRQFDENSIDTRKRSSDAINNIQTERKSVYNTQQ
jgi:hypothetical protein